MSIERFFSGSEYIEVSAFDGQGCEVDARSRYVTQVLSRFARSSTALLVGAATAAAAATAATAGPQAVGEQIPLANQARVLQATMSSATQYLGTGVAVTQGELPNIENTAPMAHLGLDAEGKLACTVSMHGFDEVAQAVQIKGSESRGRLYELVLHHEAAHCDGFTRLVAVDERLRNAHTDAALRYWLAAGAANDQSSADQFALDFRTVTYERQADAQALLTVAGRLFTSVRSPVEHAAALAEFESYYEELRNFRIRTGSSNSDGSIRIEDPSHDTILTIEAVKNLVVKHAGTLQGMREFAAKSLAGDARTELAHRLAVGSVLTQSEELGRAFISGQVGEHGDKSAQSIALPGGVQDREVVAGRAHGHASASDASDAHVQRLAGTSAETLWMAARQKLSADDRSRLEEAQATYEEALSARPGESPAKEEVNLRATRVPASVNSQSAAHTDRASVDYQGRLIAKAELHILNSVADADDPSAAIASFDQHSASAIAAQMERGHSLSPADSASAVGSALRNLNRAALAYRATQPGEPAPAKRTKQAQDSVDAEQVVAASAGSTMAPRPGLSR